MKLAWCVECDPPTLLAAGAFREYPAPFHRVGDEEHGPAMIVEAPDTPRDPGEKPSAYMARLSKIFKKLVQK